MALLALAQQAQKNSRTLDLDLITEEAMEQLQNDTLMIVNESSGPWLEETYGKDAAKPLHDAMHTERYDLSISVDIPEDDFWDSPLSDDLFTDTDLADGGDLAPAADSGSSSGETDATPDALSAQGDPAVLEVRLIAQDNRPGREDDSFIVASVYFLIHLPLETLEQRQPERVSICFLPEREQF